MLLLRWLSIILNRIQNSLLARTWYICRLLDVYRRYCMKHDLKSHCRVKAHVICVSSTHDLTQTPSARHSRLESEHGTEHCKTDKVVYSPAPAMRTLRVPSSPELWLNLEAVRSQIRLQYAGRPQVATRPEQYVILQTATT